MAPPPEYDKEPKAPDKSVSCSTPEDTKVTNYHVNDQSANPEIKPAVASSPAEAEDNKDVEALDDGQLRALLDEAITYKCPKDREGKSSLFKELLKGVEDEQACEAASRGGWRNNARSAGASNSLQDLVAALAAEPAPRRPRVSHHGNVSARTHHGGSLPSGVDTSFLLSEEPRTGGGGYVATVRCVNPAPLNERRVSTSDAADEHANRRRAPPTAPVTYTARATLEISRPPPPAQQVRTPRPQHPAPTPPAPAAPAAQQRLMDALLLKNKHTHTDNYHLTDLNDIDEHSRYVAKMSQVEVRSDKLTNEYLNCNGSKIKNLREKSLDDNESAEKKHSFEAVSEVPLLKNKSALILETVANINNSGNVQDTTAKINKKQKHVSHDTLSQSESAGFQYKKTKNNICKDAVKNKIRNAKTSKDKKLNAISICKPKEKTGQFQCDKNTNNLEKYLKLENQLASTVVDTKKNAKPSKILNKSLVSASSNSSVEIQSSSRHSSCSSANRNPASMAKTKNTNFSVNKIHKTTKLLTNSLTNTKTKKQSVYVSRPPNSLRQGTHISPYRQSYDDDYIEYLNSTIDTSTVRNDNRYPHNYRSLDYYTSDTRNVTFGPPERFFVKKSYSKRSMFKESRAGSPFYEKYISLNAYKRPLHVSKTHKIPDGNYRVRHVVTSEYNSDEENGNFSPPSVSSIANPSDSDSDSLDMCFTKLRVNNHNLQQYNESDINPTNVRPMTIGVPVSLKRHGSDSDDAVMDETGATDKNSGKVDDNVNNNLQKGYEATTIHIDNSIVTECLEDKDDMMAASYDLEYTVINNETDVDSEIHTIDKDNVDKKEISAPNDESMNMNVLPDIDAKTFILNFQQDLADSDCYQELVDLAVAPTVQKRDNIEYMMSQVEFIKAMRDSESASTADIEQTQSQGNVKETQSLEKPPDSQCPAKDIETQTKTQSNADKISQVQDAKNTDDKAMESNKILDNAQKIDAPKKSAKSFRKNKKKLRKHAEVTSVQSMSSTAAGARGHKVLTAHSKSYVVLPLLKRLLPHPSNTDNNNINLNLQNIEPSPNDTETNQALEKKHVDNTPEVIEIDQKALRLFWVENIVKGGLADQLRIVKSSSADKVDSGIAFNCVSSPEAASGGSTSSASLSAIAVDPKPLLLEAYRAVASITGEPVAPAVSPHVQKSIDENGNSLQGFSSPLSGSSQHKKPRRKKTSKNETVIKSDQIDGYQGNKDLDEVLQFIESNAEQRGGAKLRGNKHHDEDKGKRRVERRHKEKEAGRGGGGGVQRASSLEEVSRTSLRDLTRRSWADDSRAFDKKPKPPPPPPPPADPPHSDTAAELLDFQTVTKKKKPRRRGEEGGRAGGGEPPPASPERCRQSAPPSDKSNDSNDDLDSVHSLPADVPAPAARPTASYADIARTRHNIPDLIESCNYYGEVEEGGAPETPLADAAYPALEARRCKPEPAPAPPPPAPDVVAGGRPPVILRDEGAPLLGVTFGFDVNEQLLGGGDAAPPAPASCDLVACAGPLPVRQGLRYLPPPHIHTITTTTIVDYVAHAWEDIIKCGGKVRYFNE